MFNLFGDHVKEVPKNQYDSLKDLYVDLAYVSSGILIAARRMLKLLKTPELFSEQEKSLIISKSEESIENMENFLKE